MKRKPPATPTRRELADYFVHEQRRTDLSRQATDLKRLQDATEAKVLAYVRAKGGRARCAMLHGYRLSIELKNDRVEWKTELLKALAEKIGKTKAAQIVVRIAAAVEKVAVALIEPPTEDRPPGR